jgi:hypothetical protein
LRPERTEMLRVVVHEKGDGHESALVVCKYRASERSERWRGQRKYKYLPREYVP